MIIDTMPDQLKLDFTLWTRKAVKDQVERGFGVILAINTMGDYLRKWGFTPQKPKKMAYEQCPKKVQKWLDEEYPVIQKRAKEEKAEIQWGGMKQAFAITVNTVVLTHQKEKHQQRKVCLNIFL